MKNHFRLLLFVMSIIFVLSFSCPSVLASEPNEKFEVIGQNTMYFEDASIEDLIGTFDSSEEWVCIDEFYTEIDQAPETDIQFIEEGKAAFASHGVKDPEPKGYFTRTYQPTKYVLGVRNDSIPITYTVVMRLMTTTIRGTSYDVFVSVVTGPSASLSSGPYRPASGWMDPTGSIIDSGARYQITHIVQLETVETWSSSYVINNEWYSSGAAVGGEYYYRTYPTVVTTYLTLPLYGVLY